MPTKIFVGSLGNGARPEELRRLFENFGEVVECDVVNRCGFVHMTDEQDAQNAIQSLNNTPFNGQTITVEYGRQKERGGGGGGRGPPPMRSAPYDRRPGFRSMPPQSPGGYGGGRGRGPGGNFRSNGEDRRGFALLEDDYYDQRGGGDGDLFERRGGGGDGDNYRSGGGGGFRNDPYLQRDSGSGPMRRAPMSYYDGGAVSGRSTSSYQGSGSFAGNNPRYGMDPDEYEPLPSDGYGQFGRSSSSNCSNERNSNYSPVRGGRGGRGAGGAGVGGRGGGGTYGSPMFNSRGPPQQQYNNRRY